MVTTELSAAEFPPSGLEGGSNVLLLAPTSDAAEQKACTDLLTAAARMSNDALLAVTLSRSPDEQVDTWRGHADQELPNEVTVVALGEGTRGAAIVEGAGASQVSVRAIKDSRNLTQLGVEVTRQLTELARDDRRVGVCFDSVTALLEANTTDRAFRFLHVLTGQVASADAVAHYHLDPDVYDEQTVNTLMSLFDAVFERTDAGGWRVQMRQHGA